jgi:hypothetical protein
MSPSALPALLAVSVALATGLLPESGRFWRELLRRVEADVEARLLAVDRDPLLRLLAVRGLARAAPERPLEDRVAPDRLLELELERESLCAVEFFVCWAMGGLRSSNDR